MEASLRQLSRLLDIDHYVVVVQDQKQCEYSSHKGQKAFLQVYMFHLQPLINSLSCLCLMFTSLLNIVEERFSSVWSVDEVGLPLS